MKEMENVYKNFLRTNVKLVQYDDFALYGEVIEVGEDYLLLKYKGKMTIIKFDAIKKLVSW